MRPFFAVAWIIWLAVYLAITFMMPLDFIEYWVPLTWFMVFFSIEIPAVMNPDKGDTLSETIWAFRKGGASRKGFVACMGLSFATAVLWSFLALAGVAPVWLGFVPFGSFVVGLGSWLVDHFVTEGRRG